MNGWETIKPLLWVALGIVAIFVVLKWVFP